MLKCYQINMLRQKTTMREDEAEGIIGNHHGSFQCICWRSSEWNRKVSWKHYWGCGAELRNVSSGFCPFGKQWGELTIAGRRTSLIWKSSLFFSQLVFDSWRNQAVLHRKGKTWGFRKRMSGPPFEDHFWSSLRISAPNFTGWLHR